MKRDRSGSMNQSMEGNHLRYEQHEEQFVRPRSSSLPQPPQRAVGNTNPRKIRLKRSQAPPLLQRSMSIEVNGRQRHGHHHNEENNTPFDSRHELDESLTHRSRWTSGHGNLSFTRSASMGEGYQSYAHQANQDGHHLGNQQTHERNHFDVGHMQHQEISNGYNGSQNQQHHSNNSYVRHPRSNSENHNNYNSEFTEGMQDHHDENEESFHIDDNTFVSKNIQVTPNNVVMLGSNHRFREVHHQDLNIVTKAAIQVIDGRGGSRSFSPSSGNGAYVLGRGCSACVLLHVHKESGVLIAVKKINVFDRDKRHQILREIKALYSASCASMVRFYGAYYREGAISIMLEYMDRGTLRDVRNSCPAGPIPERVLAGVSYQLIWAFAYLRHENRIHRDVKPTNILVNHKGRVKLTDFGLSREIQNSINECKSFVGSFKYMSPERLRHSVYSFSSDIWACGLVLYELATHSHPFRTQGNSTFAVMEAILEHETPKLPECYSVGARELVSAMLQKEPSARPSASSILGIPWFSLHGIHDIGTAAEACVGWINAHSNVPMVRMNNTRSHQTHW